MNYIKLSKEVSYMLRHAPQEYGLEMDEEGWVSIEKLLKSLRTYNKWNVINKIDLEEMIELSDKKRHEISKDKIRAYYGHSTPMKIEKKATNPPKKLYHGTSRSLADIILREGLKPQQRQYVHLSEDIDTAVTVGKRRDNNPIILVIDAEEASKNGIKFYVEVGEIWLSDHIPGKYIIVR